MASLKLQLLYKTCVPSELKCMQQRANPALRASSEQPLAGSCDPCAFPACRYVRCIHRMLSSLLAMDVNGCGDLQARCSRPMELRSFVTI
jgi:hypothetical protein